MDLNKLTTGEKVIAGSGIVFLIAMFLPWWGIETDFGTGSNSGWDYFLTGILPLLIVIAMVTQIALAKFSTTELPKPPLPWNQIHLIAAGAVVAVLLLLRVVIGSSEGSGGFEIDLDRMYGLWVALLAAIGVGVGGFLKSKDPEEAYSGPQFPQGGQGAPPPPPPGGSSF